MRIAICDDSKDEISKIRWAMFDIKADYQIDAFQSGKELFESVKGGAVYDVLFCDIYMNGENGIDVAKEMQKLSPSTAIVYGMFMVSRRSLPRRTNWECGRTEIVMYRFPRGPPL